MNGFVGKSINATYFPAIQKVMNTGIIKTENRNSNIQIKRELSPCFLTIENAGESLYTGQSAELNLRYLAIRVLSTLSNISYHDFLSLMTLFENPCLSKTHNENKINFIGAIENLNNGNWFENQCISFNAFSSITFNIIESRDMQNRPIMKLNVVAFDQKVNIYNSLLYKVALYGIIQTLFADLLCIEVGSLCLMSTSFYSNSSSIIDGIVPADKENWIDKIYFPRLIKNAFGVDDEIDFFDPSQSLANIIDYMKLFSNSICLLRNLWKGGEDVRSWSEFNIEDFTQPGIIRNYLETFAEWIRVETFKYEPEFESIRTVG